MSVHFDDSELRSLSRHLSTNVKRLTPVVDALLDKHSNDIAANARAAAPKERPWLSTAEGVVVFTSDPLTRTIISPRDPRGESVGYRVEFGTADTAPQPFLGPAVKAGRQAFANDALAALVAVTL